MKKITGGGKQAIVAMRGRNIIDGKRKDYNGAPTIQRLEMNMNDESNCLTGVQKDNLVLIKWQNKKDGVVESDEALTLRSSGGTDIRKMPNVVQVKSATLSGYETASEGDSINLSVPNSKTRRGRVGVGVAQTLDTQSNQSVLLKGRIRRLTEVECERLQGFPDNWTMYGNYDGVVKEISRTQRYKLCGNAVSTPVVKAIGLKLKELLA